MQRVTQPSRFRRFLSAPARRALALLVAIAQVGMALAPALHAREDAQVAHFEAGGTRLHYTHDETACPACSATIGGPVEHAATAVEAAPRVHLRGDVALVVAGADRYALAHPRAPPRSDRVV